MAHNPGEILAFAADAYGRIGMESLDELYSRSRTTSIMLPYPCSVLSLRGEEVLDFLNRMSTNEVVTLDIGEQRTTVLTNEKGRIVDRVALLRAPEEVILVGSHGNGPTIKQWLDKFVLMENIEIDDITFSYKSILFYRAKSFSIKSLFGFQEGTEDGYRVSTVLLRTDGCSHFSQSGRSIRPMHLLVSSDGVDESVVSEYSGRESGLLLNQTGGPARVSETLRIESGTASLGQDFTLSENPLEAGMEGYVSFSKGCYIGQEVIARIDSYKKLQKKLVGLKFLLSERPSLAPGDLWSENMKVGYTTSHAWSPSFGCPVGLGYLSSRSEKLPIEYRSPAGARCPVEILRLPLVP